MSSIWKKEEDKLQKTLEWLPVVQEETGRG